MKAVIRLCNHRGDQVIAEYDPQTDEGVQLAQSKLTEFLNDCVRRNGIAPPIWERRVSDPLDRFQPTVVEREGDKYVRIVSPVHEVVEYLIHEPLVGG